MYPSLKNILPELSAFGQTAGGIQFYSIPASQIWWAGMSLRAVVSVVRAKSSDSRPSALVQTAARSFGRARPAGFQPTRHD